MKKTTTKINKNKTDPFAPTNKNRKVECLHCGAKFLESEMVYEKRFGEGEAFWYCKNPDCDGAGLDFDIVVEGEFPAMTECSAKTLDYFFH